MTRAKGSLLFLSIELVVGTALSVERMYFGGQLASGEGVTLDYGERENVSAGLASSIFCAVPTYVLREQDRRRG